MVNESLGTAVLTLSTDRTALIAGLEKSKQEYLNFRKDVEAASKATAAAFTNAIQPVPTQTSESFKKLFIDVQAGATTSSAAADKLRASFVGTGEAAAAAAAKQEAAQKKQIASQKEAAAAAAAHTAAIRKQIDAAQATATAFRTVGSTMTAAFTVPIVGATVASVKFASDFQRDMTKVGTLSNIAAKDVAELKQSVLELAPEVGQGPDALAQALLVVTSVGIKGADALNILKEAAKASAVGLGETKEIARAVASAITAYGAENLTAADATNKLFIAVQEGGADASEFASTLGRVVGVAAQVGVSFDEVLTSIATFTRLGVKADEAVTALRGELGLLLKPSAGARKELQDLGFSIDDVRKSVAEHGLADTLIKLIEITDGNDDALGKIIPNVRALAGVLANTGEQAGAYKDILERVKTSHGDLDKAFKETTETAAFKWEQFKSKLQTIAIEIGDQLLPKIAKIAPVIMELLNKVGALVDEFSHLPSGVQTFAEVTLVALAVGGPLMMALGSLISAWAQVRTAILLAKAAQAGFGVPGAAGGAGGAVAGATGGAAAVVTGVAGALSMSTTMAPSLRVVDTRSLQQRTADYIAGRRAPTFPQGVSSFPDLTSMMFSGPKPPGTPYDAGMVGLPKPSPPPSKAPQTKEEIARAKKEFEEMAQAEIDLQEETDRVFAKWILGASARQFPGTSTGPGVIGGSNDGGITHSGIPLVQGVGNFIANPQLNPAWRGIGTGPGKLGAKTFDARPNTFATDLFSSVPGAIQAAIQGGGSKFQAAGSAMGSVIFGKDAVATKKITEGITHIFSAEGVLGKTLSSAVPIIGSLMGPAMALLGKAFGTAGRDAVRSFATESGGFDVLHRQLGALGKDGEQMWVALTQGVGRNNSEQAKKAIAAVTEKLDAARAVVKQAITDTLTLDSRLSHLTTMTPGLQAALDAAFNAKTPEEYARAIAGIGVELDTIEGKQQQLQSTLDKYGLSQLELGSDAKEAYIGQLAVGIADEFHELKAAGIDVNAEMRAMGPNLRDFVVAAKKAGVEVPSAMQEVLQVAIDAGELFDENGKKITNIKDLGLTFGSTMETVMKKTIPDAIGRLNTVLEGLATFLGITLPKAAEDGAAAAQAALDGVNPPDLTGTSRTKYDRQEARDGNGFDGQVEGSARGSFVRPWGLQYLRAGGMAAMLSAGMFTPRGTDVIPAMLTPGEGVVSTLGMQSLGMEGLRTLNHGGGVRDIVNVQTMPPLKIDVNIDGRTAARALVPHIPAAVRALV